MEITQVRALELVAHREVRRLRVCVRKKTFFSRHEAERALRGVPYGRGMRVYACVFCSWFHLGHPSTEQGPLEHRQN